MTKTHTQPDMCPKRCKGCGKTKTVVSFTEHFRDGRTVVHDICNVCRACAGLSKHTGWTSNITYLRYKIPIGGMPPRSSKFNKWKAG